MRVNVRLLDGKDVVTSGVLLPDEEFFQSHSRDCLPETLSSSSSPASSAWLPSSASSTAAGDDGKTSGVS